MTARYFRAISSGCYARKIGDQTEWLTADPYPMWRHEGYSLYMSGFEKVQFDPLERLKRDLREAYADRHPLFPVYAKYNVHAPRQ